ncbi:MAG: hypothetical protein AAB546_03645 [Patescibacteria group bacterium]
MDDSIKLDNLRAKFLRLKRLLRNPEYNEEEKARIQKELNEVDSQILKLPQQKI